MTVTTADEEDTVPTDLAGALRGLRVMELVGGDAIKLLPTDDLRDLSSALDGGGSADEMMAAVSAC